MSPEIQGHEHNVEETLEKIKGATDEELELMAALGDIGLSIVARLELTARGYYDEFDPDKDGMG